LLIFVPVDARGGSPVRVQRLRLRNHSSQRRRLTGDLLRNPGARHGSGGNADAYRNQMGFAEPQRFARNSYEPELGGKLPLPPPARRPRHTLGTVQYLLGAIGPCAIPQRWSMRSCRAALARVSIPCAAVQTSVEIEPGQEAEVVFLLLVRPRMKRRRGHRTAVPRCRATSRDAFAETRRWWDELLGHRSRWTRPSLPRTSC
jgi:cyclic beta-1,2-glucan synthetase